MNPTIRRLTAFDLMYLRLETPAWPCHFGGLAVMEGDALLDDDGRLRFREVTERLERRLPLVPQLRRRVLVPGALGGRPAWVDDERFAIERHVHQVAVSPPGGDEELLATAARVYERVLDRRLPLWELWFFTGLREGRVAAMLKLHHAVADGMAAVSIMGALFDLSPDAADPEPTVWRPEPSPTRSALRADNLSRTSDAVTRAGAAALDPARTRAAARRAWLLTRSYAGANRDLQAPRTSLNRPVGRGRVVRVLPLDLGEVKHVAHSHDAKVNDVVLDLWIGGLRALLRSRGEPVPPELVASIPATLRSGASPASVDNQTGFMATALPGADGDPVRRLALIADRTRTIKAEQHPDAIAGFMAALAATPIAHAYVNHQRTSNTIVTNVPGPPVPVFMFGARVREIWPIIELVGNIGLICCAFSYTGRLSLVVTGDAHAFPDVDVVMDAIAREWQAFAA